MVKVVSSRTGFLAFDEVVGSQDEEQYSQAFLISCESEIKEMFDRVVEL